jgi:hypothetical protein
MATVPYEDNPSGSQKVRKIGLLRAFGHPSRPDRVEKAVKIKPYCVVKLEKRNSREFSAVLARPRSAYLAEISAFARLRPI